MDAKWKNREFMESVSTLQECIESLNVCCDLEIQFQLWLDTFSDYLLLTEGQIKRFYEKTIE